MRTELPLIEATITRYRAAQGAEMAACYLDAEADPAARFELAVALWDSVTDPAMREVVEGRVVKLLPDLLCVDPVRTASAARWLWETTRDPARSEEAVFWASCALPALRQIAPQQVLETTRWVWAESSRPVGKALSEKTVERALEPLLDTSPCSALAAARWLGQHTNAPDVKAYAARVETEALFPLAAREARYALREIRASWRTLTDPEARAVLPLALSFALNKAEDPSVAAATFTGRDGALDMVVVGWLRQRLSAPPGAGPRAALQAIVEQGNGALLCALLGQTRARGRTPCVVSRRAHPYRSRATPPVV